jgi:hypothetical protein
MIYWIPIFDILYELQLDLPDHTFTQHTVFFYIVNFLMELNF